MRNRRGKVAAVNPVTSTQAILTLKRSATALAVSAAFALPQVAHAQNVLPTGGQVVGGTAAILTPNPATMTINQSSQNANINWQSFSIGSSNSVLISQPSASSILFNRVVG